MSNDSRKLTRREFIRLAATATGAAVIASCAPAPQPAPAPTQVPAGATPIPATKAAATKVPATATPLPPKGAIEVTWWRSLSGINGQELDKMVADFNKSQSKIFVKGEFQGAYGELRDKLTAAVAAGGSAMPDMVMLADTMFANFARNKRLEPLDDLIKGSNGLDLGDFWGVVERGKLDGVYYQLPIGVSTPVFYYNEDALKKAGFSGPPKTWDQFFNEYAPKATVVEGGKTALYGFIFLANVDWWWQQSYAWMHGGELSDDKWNTYFDSPQVIEFLTRMQKLFQAGQAYLPTKADGSALAYFGSGKGAMLIESTGVIGRIDETAGGRFKPGVSYLPEGTAGRKVPTGGAGLCIMAGRTPEKKQAAWEFIRWMEQPEQIARFSKVSGYLPFTKKAADAMKDVLDKDPRRKIAIEQLAWSRGQSTIQTVPRAVDVYYDAMLQVLNLKADPKTLMPQIQKQVQQILVEEGLKK
ncbi:MAG: ABC transporter substrate-binding protein [Chloroflexota bacterium]